MRASNGPAERSSRGLWNYDSVMTEWRTRVTAFTLTQQGGKWLMLQHQRLGIVRWELPGGHVETGESLEETAARETLEETGVAVRVGELMATCVHEWLERRQRKIICFFAAVPVQEAALPAIRPEEPEVVGVAWRDPLSLDLERVSAFLHPLIGAERSKWAGGHVHFRMEHRQLADGSFAPVPASKIEAAHLHQTHPISHRSACRPVRAGP